MNTKELEKLIKLCRKNDVNCLKFNGIELNFNYNNSHTVSTPKQVIKQPEESAISSDAETELEMLAVEDPVTYERLLSQQEAN